MTQGASVYPTLPKIQGNCNRTDAPTGIECPVTEHKHIRCKRWSRYAEFTPMQPRSHKFAIWQKHDATTVYVSNNVRRPPDACYGIGESLT